MIGRSSSKVAEEAREAKLRLRELEKQIAELDRKLANPEKYTHEEPQQVLQEKTSRRPRSKIYHPKGNVRKPLRAEMRKHRNWSILWAIVAFCVLWWSLGKFFLIFKK